MQSLFQKNWVRNLSTSVGRILALSLFLIAGDLVAQDAPDLIVRDIKVSMNDPRQLLIYFGHNSDPSFFAKWFEVKRQENALRGLSDNDDAVYRFRYDVYLDGVLLKDASGKAYLPADGRYKITAPVSFADRIKHVVKVSVKPLSRGMDGNLRNNSLVKKLKFVGRAVNIVITRLDPRNDCDPYDSGEWTLLLSVSQRGEHKLRDSIDIGDVEDGVERFFRTLIWRYEQLDYTRPLRIVIEGMEEDGFAEEAWQFAGAVDVTLSPETWHNGTRLTTQTSGPSLFLPGGRQDCGVRAFDLDLLIEEPPVVPHQRLLHTPGSHVVGER
jgi:hypothetical protein